MKLQIPPNISTGPYFRTLGKADSQEIFVTGFMHKHGYYEDHINFNGSHYALCYIINGTGKYIDHNHKEYALSAGMYFQRIPEYIHSTYIDPDSEWEECFIGVGPFLAKALIRMGMINTNNLVGTAGLDQLWVDSFTEIHNSLIAANEEDLPLFLPKLLDLQQRILACGRIPANKNEHSLIKKACLLLEANLHERVDLKNLCEEQGWGYEKFRKVFKQTIGVSPGQYRLRKRIDEARRLLRTSPDMSISEIADYLGYVTVYEFSGQFSKYTGLSPKKFRQS